MSYAPYINPLRLSWWNYGIKGLGSWICYSLYFNFFLLFLLLIWSLGIGPSWKFLQFKSNLRDLNLFSNLENESANFKCSQTKIVFFHKLYDPLILKVASKGENGREILIVHDKGRIPCCFCDERIEKDFSCHNFPPLLWLKNLSWSRKVSPSCDNKN